MDRQKAGMEDSSAVVDRQEAGMEDSSAAVDRQEAGMEDSSVFAGSLGWVLSILLILILCWVLGNILVCLVIAINR